MLISVILILCGFLLLFFIPAKFVRHKIIKKIFATLYLLFSFVFVILLIFLDTGISCDRDTTLYGFFLINGILMIIYYHPVENIKLKKYWNLRIWLSLYLVAMIMLTTNIMGFGPLHQCYIDEPHNSIIYPPV